MYLTSGAVLPTPGSPRTIKAWPSPARTASISRSSMSRSLSRSVSPVARPCRLRFAVIGPALRRVTAAWLDVRIHAASRVLRSPSR